MSFENWINKIEGFALRCDRAHDDLVKLTKPEFAGNWANIKKWLEAAYLVGFDDAKKDMKVIAEQVQKMAVEADYHDSKFAEFAHDFDIAMREILKIIEKK